MTNTVMIISTGGACGTQGLADAVLGGRRGLSRMLSLDADGGKRRKPDAEDIILTLRRDLLSMREGILNGAGPDSTLRDIDYTIDQLDNALAER